MQDDLLTQLLNASSEEEKAYLLAMALVETQPPDIREAVIAAAVPHWFDAEILAALLTPAPVAHPGVETPVYTPSPVQGENPSRSDDGIQTGVSTPGTTPAYTPPPFQGENPSRSDDGIQTGVSTPGISTPGTDESAKFADLYCAIRNLNLPFVQPFGELGLTLHDLTRAGIRGHLFKHEPEQFEEYSRRAATYFSTKDDQQNLVESLYHFFAFTNTFGHMIFWQLMETFCEKQRDLSAANMLLANLIELITAGIVGGNAIERVLSVGYGMLGDLQQNRGSVSAAEDSHRKSLTIRERLAQADPANAQAQRDLSVSYERLGDLAVQRGDLSAAQQAYHQSLEICERLAQADPANAQAQRDLSVSYNKLGDIAVQRGDLSAAQQRYQQCHEILERLAQADPANAEAQRDLSVSYNKLGGIAVQRGDLNAAQRMYQQSLAIRERLAQSDPANAQAQRDLYCVYFRLYDIVLQRGNLNEAEQGQKQALEIAERLAQKDPANVQAQRDLTYSYNRLGDIAVQRGDLSAAQRMYQQGLAIAERLAQADPANAEAQRDLSISYEKLGDITVQRDLSMSCNKAGRIEELLNHAETALHLQERAFSIAQMLFAKDPQNATIRNDVAEFNGVLERLRGDEALARSDGQAALAAYQRAFDLSRQVAEEQLTNLGALRDTYWNSYKIGVTFAALGQAGQARDAFRNALALAEPFAAQPENALAQRDVAAIRRELQGCV